MKEIFALSVDGHCLLEVQTAMRPCGKHISWTVSEQETLHIRLKALEVRPERESTCCHLLQTRKIALARTVVHKSVPSAWSSMTLGMNWHAWNVCANFTRLASWSGSNAKQNAPCTNLWHESRLYEELPGVIL